MRILLMIRHHRPPVLNTMIIYRHHADALSVAHRNARFIDHANALARTRFAHFMKYFSRCGQQKENFRGRDMMHEEILSVTHQNRTFLLSLSTARSNATSGLFSFFPNPNRLLPAWHKTGVRVALTLRVHNHFAE